MRGAAAILVVAVALAGCDTAPKNSLLPVSLTQGADRVRGIGQTVGQKIGATGADVSGIDLPIAHKDVPVTSIAGMVLQMLGADVRIAFGGSCQ